ncbi:MAG: DUF1622 domain-containing protein [Clostridia bacterium]|nr:DUF1622 domain-containing protein [Clostridia bacterium]
MQFFENGYEFLEEAFKLIVEYGVLILEVIGVVIILVTAIHCIIGILKHDEENLRLKLASGVALALEFMLGGEVLRTVLAQSFVVLGRIACVIALRASLTFLLHWETKNEKKEE